jgi:hypothetical protein
MYRWFLLAEVLKRLLWFEEVFASAEGRILLLRAVLMLRRALEDQSRPERAKDPTLPGLDAVSRLGLALGCTAAYIPDDKNFQATNESRNAAKRRALESAARKRQTVRLIAETGYSYLCSHGPFYQHVQQLILESGRFHVLLANPSFVEAHGISAAYREPNRLNPLGLHPIFVEKFGLIESTIPLLPPERIEIRFSRYGIPATVLITDDVIFYEPYFRNDRRNRETRLFDTFELQLETDGHARKLIEDDFQFRWDNADTYDVLKNLRPEYEQALASLVSLWKPAAYSKARRKIR